MRLTILLVLLLLHGGLRAQSYEESDFTKYTRLQGLSNNSISGIVQDSMDYIWISTRKGLNRFDGRFFNSYFLGSADVPLRTNVINELRMQGREMIGTTGEGAFVYDPGNHLYKTMVIPSDSSIYYWTNNVKEAIRDRKGDYVLSTKTGLYVFDPQGKLIRRYDRYLAADAGRVELLFGGGLTELADGRILQENDVMFSAYDPDGNRVDTFYGDKHPAFKRAVTDGGGRLRDCFLGGKDQLFVVDKEKNALDLVDLCTDGVKVLPLPFDAGAELDEDNSQLFMLNDSLIALTGKTSGFYLFELHVASARLLPVGKKHFDGKRCTTLFKDREGRLWVGTNDGLYKENLSNPFFKAYDLARQDAGLKQYIIRAIYTNHDKVFIGLRSLGGILVLDKATQKLERHFYLRDKDSMCNNISQFVPYNADTVWVGTRAGLFWLDQRSYHTGRIPVPPGMEWMYHNNVLYSLEDHHKNIWISFGRLNSAVRYDRATRQFMEVSAQTDTLLRITYCFSIAEDKEGHIWLGGDGLCRWDPVKRAIDTLIPYPEGTRRLRNYMGIMDRDADDNLWLYAGSGILQYNCKYNRFYLRKAENNLTDADIQTHSPIIDGHIWLGSDNGIAAFNIRDYSSRLFTYADGLPTVAVTSLRRGSWYDAEENTIYLGSRHHLITFTPDTSHFMQKAPVLFIDEITTASGVVMGDTSRIDLSYSNNSAQVSFNAVNFQNPEDNRFAYLVTPSPDSAWHLLANQQSVNFNNLAPGKYHVRVKLLSANNRWPEQEKDLLLVVHPPFWQTGWFIVLAAVAVLLVIGVIYRNRVGRMREKLSLDKQVAEYEMKALHAQMNPHFIFNALNSIREMILNDDNRNASRYLSRFARLIRLNLEHSRQTFITLQQNIEYLESYLEMEQLRFPDFSFRIETSRGVDRNEARLAPMLIQPLVENAIWHGLVPKERDKWVHIRFYQEGNKLVCEIEDNGIGIRKSLQNKTASQQTHVSMGIGNIRQRIAVLNEKYRISCSLSIKDKTDVPGMTDSGTLITLVLPVHEEELIL